MTVHRVPGGGASTGGGEGGVPDPHATTHLSNGSDPISGASTSVGGLMSAADKTKLNTVATNAVALTGIPDVVAGGASGFMTGTQATKLAGIETAATADQTGAEIATAIATQTVPGSLTFGDAASPARRYRVNMTSSGNVLLQAGAADIMISAFANADFTGTERQGILVDKDSDGVWVGPIVQIAATLGGTAVHSLNAQTGVALLGGKNSHTSSRISGRGTIAGPPTSGTWAAGDTVQDAVGVWWVCTNATGPVWATPTPIAVVRTVSGTTDTLVIADAGKVVETGNASATTITVPPNSSVAFPVGTTIEFCQTAAGQLTLAAGAGVTLNNPSGLKTRAQWSTLAIRKRTTDTWVVCGDATT
jgi:hypothetical protein